MTDEKANTNFIRIGNLTISLLLLTMIGYYALNLKLRFEVDGLDLNGTDTTKVVTCQYDKVLDFPQNFKANTVNTSKIKAYSKTRSGKVDLSKESSK
ncbi:MAG: hypothetical protein HY998_03405 [candidate division NC10 bacterium]|nr:hypothetical protein [candidate division NC10 bacterium]